jgi:hypothetical protein
VAAHIARLWSCHIVMRRGTRLLERWPRQGKPSMEPSRSQLARHFLTEEAYGIVQTLWRDQATYVWLHEHA